MSETARKKRAPKVAKAAEPSPAAGRKREVLVEIPNLHGSAAPKVGAGDGDYLSYFENSLGEQWLFVRRRGEPTGTVYGGDVGWEGHEVRFRTPAQVKDELSKQGARASMLDRILALANPDPLVPGLVLQDEEKAWLNLAWWTSCSFAEQREMLNALAEWVAEQIPAEHLRKHPNTAEYRAAHQTLALVVGRAAGMRGLDDNATAELLAKALDVIAARTK